MLLLKNKIKIIALVLLGLLFSCNNDKMGENTLAAAPTFEIYNERSGQKNTPVVLTKSLACIQNLEESVFQNIAGFSKNILNELLKGKEKEGWSLEKSTADFLFFSNTALKAKGAIKVYSKEKKCERIAVFQQRGQNFSLAIYDALGNFITIEKALPSVAVNDFLIPKYQDPNLEKYKSNINFLLTKKGELQACLNTEINPVFKKIEDLNDVIVNWENGKFVKEIIEVE